MGESCQMIVMGIKKRRNFSANDVASLVPLKLRIHVFLFINKLFKWVFYYIFQFFISTNYEFADIFIFYFIECDKATVMTNYSFEMVR